MRWWRARAAVAKQCPAAEVCPCTGPPLRLGEPTLPVHCATSAGMRLAAGLHLQPAELWLVLGPAACVGPCSAAEVRPGTGPLLHVAKLLPVLHGAALWGLC